MSKHLIKLNELADTLISEDLAREIRDEIEAHVNAGDDVVIDFTDVAATTQFVTVLFHGLSEFLAEKGDTVRDVGVQGMSEPIRRKVIRTIENPTVAEPFSAIR